jgi:hypothetical protein
MSDMTPEQFQELLETLYDTRSDIKAIQTDLAYHIRRTDILEGRFEALDKDVTKLRGFFTIAGWVVAALATVLTVLNQLGLI